MNASRVTPPPTHTRRVTFVDGWALVPMPPALWFQFADLAEARGCRIPQLLDQLSREAAPEPATPAPDRPRAPEAEARLRLIADRYFDPTAGDDEDFLAWLDGALRKPLDTLSVDATE